MKLNKETFLDSEPCSSGIEFARYVNFNPILAWYTCSNRYWMHWLLRKARHPNAPEIELDEWSAGRIRKEIQFPFEVDGSAVSEYASLMHKRIRCWQGVSVVAITCAITLMILSSVSKYRQPRVETIYQTNTIRMVFAITNIQNRVIWQKQDGQIIGYTVK
jgi:hypothetical protein